MKSSFRLTISIPLCAYVRLLVCSSNSNISLGNGVYWYSPWCGVGEHINQPSNRLCCCIYQHTHHVGSYWLDTVMLNCQLMSKKKGGWTFLSRLQANNLDPCLFIVMYEELYIYIYIYILYILYYIYYIHYYVQNYWKNMLSL